ncbi:uncharacterized protein [Rutidosis leptorrhynchoides]|uniref:uncharacterized protein n=1 Tax=Rutidosis leptorrhynchoides TaxID=125765 RepID=UPI003A992740
MCTISLNIRGIGQTGKINWLKNICNKEKPTIFGLQETKCGQTSDNTIESFWGNSDFKFIQKDSVGASGGILTIWDTNIFSVTNAIEGEFFLAICGSWAGHNSELAFINVYGPHSNAKKLRLWNELTSFINSINIPHIVFGDFNEVRNKTERMNSEYNQPWADNFNRFISNLGLIDLPLGGKKFTRICEKTMKFSKLDRFLVSDGIFTIWPNTYSKTLDRDLSDHCPIILRNNLIDSGPKPIRVFDAWLDLKDAESVVEKAWSLPTNGNRPDCIFRNKLKNVKMELKKHSNQLDNIDSQIREHLSECNNWEQTAETRPLSEIEKQKWLDEKMQHITKEKKKINMLKQKSRIKWALEGSYYKILTKILSNRLAKVIHKVIGSEQTAFLKGRNILDSVLIANEIIDELKRKKHKGLIFKVDFEKAFDCIEWDFLFKTMQFMGFGLKWISFIRACLSSSSISVLINGSPTKEFSPGRGIRQGDPISPFLFIIVAEGLNILVKRALANGLLQGLRIGNDNLIITHLQYADDTIFFGEWNKRSAKHISKLLKCFENISGLKVNFRKSKLYGIGTSIAETEQMARYINCSAGSTPFTYLGLPIGVPTSHISSWQPIIEKFDKRLSDWAAKSISFGGRLTIIKSILSSIPLYYFSLFHAPSAILKALESKRRKFFWGGSSNDNKINWIKWDQIILPYENGGLNVGSLFAKNISLLCKWWWRFKNEDNALWVKIIKSIYGPGGGGGLDSNILCRNISGRTIWKEIIKAGKVADNVGTSFTSSILKRIGNGTTINFWHDKWIGSENLKTLFHRLYMLESHKEASVADRILHVNSTSIGKWEWTRIPRGRAMNELEELNNLLSSVTISDRPDSWKYSLDTSGIFTTSSLSNLINTLKYGINSRNLSLPRNKYVPQKVFIFSWRVIQQKIPVRCELDKKGIDLHTILCPLCDNHIETVDHALINCQKVSSIWIQILDWWNQNNSTISNINEAIISDEGFSLNPIGASLWQATKWITCYILWKHRNLKVFSGDEDSVTGIRSVVAEQYNVAFVFRTQLIILLCTRPNRVIMAHKMFYYEVYLKPSIW